MDPHILALRSNIPKLYGLMASSGMLLVVPVIIPFFESNGLTLREIFTLQAIFAATLALSEIPSGYLSDRWGRKPTIIVGSLALFLAIVTYALSGGFWGFVLAEIFIALGVSFHSGTIEAMTYDTMLELDETDGYRAVSGHQAFLHFGSEGVGSVIGGLLAIISLRAPLWATLIPFGIACIVSFTLEEPHRHKLQETRHFKAMWDIFVHTIIKSPPLRGIILIHSITATLTLCLFWFTQPYQLAAGLPLALFGVTHAIISGSGAVASKYTHALSQFIDDRLFLILICAAVIISYVILGTYTALWGLAFFFVGRVCWGFLAPLTSDVLNRMTPSEIRATTLSIRGFVFRMLFVVIGPMLGAIADRWDTSSAMFTTAIGGAVALTAVFLLMAPVWRDIPS